MKVWIGLKPNDRQGMEFNLTPLEFRDLLSKPDWPPTPFFRLENIYNFCIF